jgi:hypothetical protein
VTYQYTDPNAADTTTYYFTPCGMTQETCPGKNPAVGMGVRIAEDTSKGQTCDVLGSFSSDFAVWKPLLEDDTGDFIGIQLVGGDGSACSASTLGDSYSLTVNFNCYSGNPKDRIKAGPEATGFIANSGNLCSPVYQIDTCLACADACALPLSPSAANPPGGGPGWFGWTLIIMFGILTPLYVVGGFFMTGRLPVPFDRCSSISRRTSMQAGNGQYSSAASNGATSYGSVSDSI